MGDVNTLLLEDHWPEHGRADYLGLKRALEDDYNLSLTLTEVRRHVDHHVTYSFTAEERDSLTTLRERGSQ